MQKTLVGEKSSKRKSDKMAPTIFGQIVIGPPGSGKTTYCDGMSQFLKSLGRNVAIVNLDPANEMIPYKADVDVAELIQVRFKMGVGFIWSL